MTNKKSSRLQWAKHQQRWFGKWHTYLGIVAGLIIAIVGLTGSILVFQDEIDVALNKNLFEVSSTQRKISLEEITPLVKAKYPSLQFTYVMNETDDPRLAYRFYNFIKEQEFFVNPYTATISGKRLYESSFIRVVTDIHTSLLVPKVGEYITGIASLILLVLTISGLRLWIPQKWKQIKSVLTVKVGSSFKRQNYDWHNVLGFYSSPVVAMLALTGVCIAFSVVIVPILFLLSGKSPQGIAQIFSSKSVYTKNAKPLSTPQAAMIAYLQMPGTRIAGIGLPDDSVGVYRFDIVSETVPNGGKREMLVIDQYSGKVLLNSRIDFPSVGDAYLAWLTPIHYGSFGGMPTKILACIGGLTPLALFITGFIVWYPRWRKQKKAGSRLITQADDESLGFVHHQHNIVAEIKSPIFNYFKKHLIAGVKYALWALLITALMGAFYGIASGIVLQPAVFGIAFTTVLVVINFFVAFLCLLFNIIFLAPFKKGSRMLVRYFSLSFSFCMVFLICYMLLMNTGMHLF